MHDFGLCRGSSADADNSGGIRYVTTVLPNPRYTQPRDSPVKIGAPARHIGTENIKTKSERNTVVIHA